jgi:hypothetical protein
MVIFHKKDNGHHRRPLKFASRNLMPNESVLEKKLFRYIPRAGEKLVVAELKLAGGGLLHNRYTFGR